MFREKVLNGRSSSKDVLKMFPHLYFCGFFLEIPKCFPNTLHYKIIILQIELGWVILGRTLTELRGASEWYTCYQFRSVGTAYRLMLTHSRRHFQYIHVSVDGTFFKCLLFMTSYNTSYFGLRPVPSK